MNLKKLFIIINIIFFIYFSIQLLVFTDEFALKNIGFFNHAVAGLAEIIGIIFLSFSFALSIIFLKGTKNQLPIFLCIFISLLPVSKMSPSIIIFGLLADIEEAHLILSLVDSTPAL